jgi:hypothetical protein
LGHFSPVLSFGLPLLLHAAAAAADAAACLLIAPEVCTTAIFSEVSNHFLCTIRFLV